MPTPGTAGVAHPFLVWLNSEAELPVNVSGRYEIDINGQQLGASSAKRHAYRLLVICMCYRLL